jgi:hypothetical protein
MLTATRRGLAIIIRGKTITVPGITTASSTEGEITLVVAMEAALAAVGTGEASAVATAAEAAGGMAEAAVAGIAKGAVQKIGPVIDFCRLIY